MANDPWKHMGEIAAYAVTAAVGAVGSIIYQKKRKSESVSPEEDGREESALLRVEIHLDRISRTLEEHGTGQHSLNTDLIRAYSEISWIKRSVRELSERVSDLESKSTGTREGR